MNTSPSTGRTPDRRWNRVVELFDKAVTMGTADRELWLKGQCGDDPALLAEVQSLLDASRAEAETAARHRTPEGAEGRRYGVWETIRVLGSGGMGSVLLAKRVEGEFEQTAALKLIAPHLVGPFFLERFLTERQILANLNHPNITKLLDGGVGTDGAPFLVMEYIDGLPLNRYADEHRLTVAGRLKLFLKVCDAVEFAHRNLVVHRDLKPGNILVESSTGEPKLLDFGTARMIPPDGGSDATATTNRLVTPRYASPEALRHAPITTQADVFSLGVLLYEQVTGVWPFGDLEASPVEVAEKITRAEITPPETAITEEAAQTRGCAVRELKGLARGDLATILRKATEADLGRRYKSVADLASDIRAYLDGRPVMAQRPTLVYRASKFVRRHWAGVASAALILVSIVAAALYSRQQATFARKEADRAFSTVMFLKTIIQTAGTQSRGKPITVKEAVAYAESYAQRSDMDSRPGILASLAVVSSGAGDFKASERLAEQAAREARSIGDAAAEADALMHLCAIYSETSRTSQSTALIPRALSLVKGLDNLKRVRRVRYLAEASLAYNTVYGTNPNGALGEKHIREALRHAGDNSILGSVELAQAYSILAYAHVLQNDFEGEAKAIEAGLEISRKSGNPRDSMFALMDQRVRFARNRDFAGAERVSRERYRLVLEEAGEGYTSLHSRLLWAMDLGRSGNWDAASRELAQSREAIARLSPEAKLSLNWIAPNISAFVENRKGNAPLALRLARESLQAGLANHWDPQRDARMGDAYLELGIALRLQNDFSESITNLQRAESIYLIAWGPSHNRTKFTQAELTRAKANDSGLPGIP